MDVELMDQSEDLHPVVWNKATMLFCVLAGSWLRSKRSAGDKALAMLVGGILLIIAGPARKCAAAF